MEELRNFLRSSQVIEKLHKIQVDFYMLFTENLNILQEDLKTSDFIQMIDLFKTNECRFLIRFPTIEAEMSAKTLNRAPLEQR